MVPSSRTRPLFRSVFPAGQLNAFVVASKVKIGAREIALRLMFSVEDRNMRFDPAPHQPTIEELDGNRNFSRTAGIVA